MHETLPPQMMEWIRHYGDLGLFVAMFLESSIVPIPSEAVVVAAGTLGLSLSSIVIFGALGSTLGAMIGYAIGRYAGLPLILRFGKFIFIRPHHIEKAQHFAHKHGLWGVLIGRVIPVVPFKVFSIASGMASIPFGLFIVCTIVGVIPRLFLLGLIGAALVSYSKIAILAILAAILLWLIWRWFHK